MMPDWLFWILCIALGGLFLFALVMTFFERFGKR